MSPPTLRERLCLARLARRHRRVEARARGRDRPLLGLGRAAAPPGEQLLVPSDLRPADPSFASELAAGQMGLAGAVVDLGGRSPFAVSPPNADFAHALHGFAWLGHLRAAATPEATALARRLVADWIANAGATRHAAVAMAPDVTARRVTAWIANAGLLLEDADAASYAAVGRSLGADLRRLERAHRDARPAPAALQCLAALILADLAFAGRERHLARLEPVFLAEIDRQILADGGHASRNPDAVVALLLDLLPLRQCYSAREQPPPPALVEAIARMLRFLAAMQLGDGGLARFNGHGGDHRDALATVLSFATEATAGTRHLAGSGYVRLAAAGTVLLMDAGAPPALERAGTAAAGCLSFELSDGRVPMLANGGAPGGLYVRERAAARATASHSTLVLDARSSARLVATPALEMLCGGPALAGPAQVTARLVEAGGGATIEASHDGYLASDGLVHTRRLALAADGRRLDGRDRLGPRKGVLRLKRDLPVAIHFHLAPGVEAAIDPAGNGATIAAPGTPGWRLTVAGALASLEASTDFTAATGPRRRRQIVLRATCPGELTVEWALERQA